MTVAVDQDDVTRRHGRVPHHLVGGRSAVRHKEQMVAVENARGIALRGRHRPRVIEQLAKFIDGVTDVGAQHVLAKELVEHLPDRALQKGHATRVPRAVPGVGAVLRVVGQRAEERWGQAVEVGARFADDVTGDELRRVFKHVNEAVQLAQDVIRNMARSLRLAIEVNRDVGIAKADFFDEFTQVEHRRIEFGARRKFFVVNRQNESRCARLLLRKLREVAVTGHPNDLDALFFDRFGQRAYAQTAGILRPVVFINDDDWKLEFHRCSF